MTLFRWKITQSSIGNMISLKADKMKKRKRKKKPEEKEINTIKCNYKIKIHIFLFLPFCIFFFFYSANLLAMKIHIMMVIIVPQLPLPHQQYLYNRPVIVKQCGVLNMPRGQLLWPHYSQLVPIQKGSGIIENRKKINKFEKEYYEWIHK